MKYLQSLLLTLALLAPAAFVAPGCASANLNAYKSASTTQVTVEAAMTAWGDYIHAQDVAGTPVSMNMRAQVKGAYEKYQAAAAVVASAGASYSQAVAKNSPELGAFQNSLNIAIGVASASLSDLVSLIRAFGVHI